MTTLDEWLAFLYPCGAASYRFSLPGTGHRPVQEPTGAVSTRVGFLVVLGIILAAVRRGVAGPIQAHQAH